MSTTQTKNFTNPVCEVNLRPGGKLLIVMRARDGIEHTTSGIFHEIVEPERLTFTNNAVNMAGIQLIEGLTTVTFAEHGTKTILTIHTTASGHLPEVEFMLNGMETGWNQSLDRLEATVS